MYVAQSKSISLKKIRARYRIYFIHFNEKFQRKQKTSRLQKKYFILN